MKRETIHNFPDYEIADDGSIYSRLSGKRLEPFPNKKNFRLMVGLRRKKKTYQKYIHLLLLETFVGPCPPNAKAKFINGDVTDVSLANLTWRRDAKHKLTVEDRRSIWREYYEDDMAQSMLAIKYGVSSKTIYRIIRRQRLKNYAEGERIDREKQNRSQ